MTGKTMSELQQDIAAWADSLYPDRKPYHSLVKLVEEVAECLARPDDPLELADIVILALDIAHLKGVDLQDAIVRKMEINRNRAWRVDHRTGLMSHVGDGRLHRD